MDLQSHLQVPLRKNSKGFRSLRNDCQFVIPERNSVSHDNTLSIRLYVHTNIQLYDKPR